MGKPNRACWIALAKTKKARTLHASFGTRSSCFCKRIIGSSIRNISSILKSKQSNWRSTCWCWWELLRAVTVYTIFVLYSLQWVVRHYFFEFFDCHFSLFSSTLWFQITVSNKLNEHPNLSYADAFFPAFLSAFGPDSLTKVAHSKHLTFQFFTHCNAKLFFENFLFLRSCSRRRKQHIQKFQNTCIVFRIRFSQTNRYHAHKIIVF